MSEEEEDYGDSGSDWRSSAGGSETSYDEDFGLGEPSVEEVVGSSGRTPYTVRTPTACARPHVLPSGARGAFRHHFRMGRHEPALGRVRACTTQAAYTVGVK